MTTESYIVRIYRRDPRDTQKMIGLVEATDGTGVRRPFTTPDELCAVLNMPVSGGSLKRQTMAGLRRKPQKAKTDE